MLGICRRNNVRSSASSTHAQAQSFCYPDDSRSRLVKVREPCDADVWSEPLPPSADELRKQVAGCDGLLSLLTERIDAAAAGRRAAVESDQQLRRGLQQYRHPGRHRARHRRRQHARRADRRHGRHGLLRC